MGEGWEVAVGGSELGKVTAADSGFVRVPPDEQYHHF